MTFKKIFTCALACAVIGAAMPAVPVSLGTAVTANAAEIVESGSCGENVTYNLDSEGALTLFGTGAMTDYDYETDQSPFFKNNDIKSLVIEDGIKSIGKAAFYNCRGLISAKIPDSVTSIGESAFAYTTKLQNLNLPDSVSEIGYSAFLCCSSLPSVHIPASLSYISDQAFQACVSLTEVEIPENIKEIGIGAFMNSENLKAITILDPECVIGSYLAPPSAVIYGYKDSTAQTFAKYYGYTFKAIDTIIGDVNDDNALDSSDAALILKDYATVQGGGTSTLDKSVADFNSDSLVDSSDAALILKTYADNQAK